jgi:hypothetical protein
MAHDRRLRWRRVLPRQVPGRSARARLGALARAGRADDTLGAGIASALEGPLGRPGTARDVAAGAAAGLTAAFSAPIASFIFVLEELRLRPSRLVVSTVLPAVLASYLVTQRLVGPGPMFEVPPVPTPPAALMPLFLALGLAAGMLGVAFNRGLLRVLDVFEAAPGPRWLGAAVVGIAAAGVACWLPAAIGGGEKVAGALIRGSFQPTLAILVVFLLVKFTLTLASYGCGVPGGIFAPQLVLGAAVGAIVHVLAPDLGGGTLGPVLATAGMVAVFAASVRAPMTGLLRSAHPLGTVPDPRRRRGLAASLRGNPPRSASCTDDTLRARRRTARPRVESARAMASAPISAASPLNALRAHDGSPPAGSSYSSSGLTPRSGSGTRHRRMTRREARGMHPLQRCRPGRGSSARPRSAGHRGGELHLRGTR